MSRLGSIDSQYFDADGYPLQGGLLYFYETESTTPKTTYIDSSNDLQNSWPIVLDAAGVPPPIFFTGTAKIVLKDKDGTEIRTMDPVVAYTYELGDPLMFRLGSIDSQLFDQNGNPLPYGKLYVYENGTSTPKATYGADDSVNPWPVVFDEVGFWGDIFFMGKARLVLKDQNGVQIRTLDDVETLEIDETIVTEEIIANCPQSVTVAVSQNATFTVELVGAPEDYTITWYKNLSLQAGEAGTSFTVANATEADNGSQILVTVEDADGIQFCGNAILTIDTDTNYSCSSYEDWLGTLYARLSGSRTAGIAYRVDGESGAPNYPFSTDNAIDQKHVVLTNYVAGATDYTGWPTGSPNTSAFTVDYFSEDITDRRFCSGNGQMDAMGAFNPSTAALGSRVIIPAGAVNFTQAGNGEPWGDHYFESLIIGHDIGRTGDIISGGIVRQSGKLWRWTRDGTNYYEDDPAALGVSAGTSGTDVTMTLYINTGQSLSGPSTNSTFTVVGAATSLNLVQVHIYSGVPYEALGDDGQYNMCRDVSIKCYYAGTVVTHEGVQWYNQRKATSKSPTNIVPWYYQTHPGRYYAYPQYFYGGQYNFATFAAGRLGLEDRDEIMSLGQAAWDNNLYSP